MNPSEVLSFGRRIHMDFHTPDIPWDQAMKNFNVKRYVETLKKAEVNSLVSFTKCHHGYSYYKTDLGVPHPALDGVDMFGKILEECKKEDIRVMAYYSVGWLTTVQKDHPEWMERNKEGDMVDTMNKPKTGPWANICLNSPYVEEVVLPEIEEIAKLYDADGLWLDIIEPNPCYCEHCRKRYDELYNKPYPENDEELKGFVLESKKRFIVRCGELLRSLRPHWVYTYNSAGRDREIVEDVDFCSIETHPGAPWYGERDAWTKALLTYKLLQNYNKPWESCTCRFIHSWGGWDDQPVINNTMVMSRIVAHGGMVNLGDQAYPDGSLDESLYEGIGESYTTLKPLYENAYGTRSKPLIGLVTSDFDIYAHITIENKVNSNYFGATKILSENHWQFDVLHIKEHDKFAGYACLVLPEIGALDEASIKALEDYVARGGRLLITGNTGVKEGEFQLGELCGVQSLDKSPYSIGYLKCNQLINQGLRKSPLLIPGDFYTMITDDKAISLGEHIYPVIEPDYDEFMIFRNAKLSPPGDLASTHGAVLNTYGKGQCVYYPANMFEIFNVQQQWYISNIMNNTMKLLVKDPWITLEAPKSLEMNVTYNEEKTVVHLIQYSVQNESNNVRENIPAVNVKCKISLDTVGQGELKVIPVKDYKLTHEEGFMVIEFDSLEKYTQILIKH